MNATNTHRIALWVNESCAFGKGRKHWLAIDNADDPRIAMATTNLGTQLSCTQWVGDCLTQGIERFVAVGGDGTVNLLANVLAKATARAFLGAIGTGSSNDFHKPARKRIAGFPCRLDFEEAIHADLFHVRDRLTNEVRYGLVNASVGITAEANHYFNHPDSVLRAFKRGSVNLAILYAALQTLWRYQPQTVRVNESLVRITNLGLVKNRHFSGSLKYDEGAEADSGDYLVYLCHGMSRLRSLMALSQLSRGVFVKSRNAEKFRTKHLRLHAEKPFAFELDGEVMRTSDLEVAIEPRRLWLCP